MFFQALTFLSKKKKRSTNVDDGTPEDELITASTNHIAEDDAMTAFLNHRVPVAADDVTPNSSSHSSFSSYCRETSSEAETESYASVAAPNRRSRDSSAVGGGVGSSSISSMIGINTCNGAGNNNMHCLNKWRPILLFIPLRLGLTEINADYVDAIKVRPILVC